jgi:D-3-phosphoglycerate dehydrogenase
VNIAQMNVGREQDQPGGEAIGVVKLDSVPPDSALDEVKTHPNILSVSLIRMPRADEWPSWLSF